MKKLTVTITGQDVSDLTLALEEVQAKVDGEFREGWDRNETGSYHFRVEEDS